MAGDPKNPVVGTFVFDGAEFAAYAVDLPPGACQGMTSTREGFLEVCQELISNQAVFGIDAGITQQAIADLIATNLRIERIDAFLPALLKAVEMLTETRYLLDDQRQRIVLDAASCIDRRAKRRVDILARYERTRVYRSAIAKKGVKTREKNAEQTQSPTLPAPPVVIPPGAGGSEATPKRS